MLAGTVTVQVADQVVTLQVGDAVGFCGDLPHSYANHDAESARFSLAVFEPGVGTGTGARASAAAGSVARGAQQSEVGDA